MTSQVTHMRRSLHELPGREGQRNGALTVVSWYNQRLQTWQASSPNYPYFAEARPAPIAILSATRREAITSLLGSIEATLYMKRQPESLACILGGDAMANFGLGEDGTVDAGNV